jgi:ribonuclease-3 family protein
MATVAATMTTPAPARHHRFRVRAAWDMNPGAATIAAPKTSKPKPALGQSPATATTPARAPPPTHADLFARSSEGQGIYHHPSAYAP